MKNLKHKITALALSSALLLFCAGCNDVNNNSQNNGGNGGGNQQGDIKEQTVLQPVEITNETYGSFWMRCHDYKTMPVGTYNSITPTLLASNIYEDYKEAGVNFMIGCWEGISIDALNRCADNGIAYIVSPHDPDGGNFRCDFAEQIAQAKYHQAFAGVTVIDEPCEQQFQSIAATQDYLDGLMPEMTTGALWWSNLFPNYATNDQLYYKTYNEQELPPELKDNYSYERYVREYIKICKPKFLSSCNYAIHVGKDNHGKLRNDFLPNMSIIRSAALEANIPFWVFIQAYQINQNAFAPNRGELLWQVNTALSYGAKGIEYFTGVAAWPQNNWEGAMFDGNGGRTEVYPLVKEANTQIAAVDEVLMCSKSKGLIVVGDMPIGKDSNPLQVAESDRLQTYGELSGASAKHILIGCFDYNGKTAFYITNNTIQVGDADNVTLNFKSAASGYTVIGGAKQKFSGESLNFSLDEGQGALVVIG